METDVIKALLPAFAAGFANQRLMEILDPVLVRLAGEERKRISIGVLSAIVGIGFALGGSLRALNNLGIEKSDPWFLAFDVFITGLIISAGTEGFNSILKFMSYAKEEKKQEARLETVRTSSARAVLNRQLSERSFRAAADFEPSGDLAKDLADRFKLELGNRFPDQFNAEGWQDRTFDAFVTDLTLFKAKDAATDASDTVALALGLQLSDDAHLRIQNRVTLTASPKKVLVVMEDEVASA